MSSKDKYDAAFVETLMLGPKDLATLKYQEVESWDSVGHMALIAAVEEAFEIELDIDDIIEFSSYEAGKAILVKYDVQIEPV